MARATIPRCVLFDDQFAVMPRHLADAYFDLDSFPPHGATAAQAATRFPEEAVRETFGTQPSPEKCPTVSRTLYPLNLPPHHILPMILPHPFRLHRARKVPRHMLLHLSCNSSVPLPI